MASAQETNTAKLPAFHELKRYQVRAVMLKYDGKTGMQIANNLNDEFGTDYAERTVLEWFNAGGVLEAAYQDFLDAMAAQSLKEARSLIKRAMRPAAAKLITQLNSTDSRLAHDSAKALLNKYIPDRQVVSDAPDAETDLPPELARMAELIAKDKDGPDPVNESAQGSQAGQTAGQSVG